MLPASLDRQRFALLLDVDGTLLDIAPTPLEVVIPPRLRATLTALSDRTGGALALVSGRPIAELDFLFEPLRLAAAGAHGAEVRFEAAGLTRRMPVEPLPPELIGRLQALAERHPGMIIEDKTTSVALHYRQIRDRGLDVVDAVYEVCKPFPPDCYELLTGKAVLEVKAVGFSKGTAVRELMSVPPFLGRTPIFIGDDTTDEAAFEVMPEFDGLAVSVGGKVRASAGHFDTPQAVREWLAAIASTPDAATPIPATPPPATSNAL